MFVHESRPSRRLVGHLARGEDLVGSLLALCREHQVRAGEVRALGTLETAVLGTCEGGGRIRPVGGNPALVALSGTLSAQGGEVAAHVHVLLSRGAELLGGHLDSARALAVELVVECWDDLAAATVETPRLATWAQVAVLSERLPAAEPEADADEMLQPGDVLLHPTFGRCEVLRIEGGTEFAHVRLKNGRVVRLSLDVVKVTRAGDEGGRRVFRARVDG